jgi:uncharacterized membrane protein
MNVMLFALTLFSALGSGLMAGLFFVFSIAVMDALDRLPPAQGIAAMQSINVVILNPLFFAVFFGTALAALVLAVVAVVQWQQPGAAWLFVGSLFYLVGCILVTVIRNVPLNEALAAVNPTSEEGGRLWTRYLTDWTSWNHVRTVLCVAAAASFIVAIYRHASLSAEAVP